MNSNRRFATTNPWARPRYPRWKTSNYHRECDMTFSLGRETNYEEVFELLKVSGCIDPVRWFETLRSIRIHNNSVDNGQVMVFCTKPGLSDEFADKLNALPGDLIRKCHSYTDKDIPVKFSFIHPSVDIEMDIVRAHLEKDHGPVKEWFELKEKKYNIPTGAYIFIMKEEDLKVNPLPEQIFLNHLPCYISYRTQKRICYKCKQPGHIANNCTVNLFPQLLSDSNAGEKRSTPDVFLPGYLVGANQNSVSKKNYF